MTDTFTPRKSKINYDRHQSPPIINNDRYTPPSFEDSNRKKPETYHLGAKNNQKPIDNEPPFRSSSPPIENSYPSSSNGPELYHLKNVENDNEIHNRRSSSAFSNNNRVSPMPLQDSTGRKSEMYYLKTLDDNIRQTPPIHNNNYEKPTFNDDRMIYDDHNQQKVTVYVLKATEQENLPLSHIQRTPSPIVLTNRSEPVSNKTVSYSDRVDGLNKRNQYPAVLTTVPTTVRHVPLSHSKASQSIQRSMMKYRFNGY
ncbi:unnamed protein product [Rotaria sordida]|uniref:Uncharacterized protein n=1 Tax=Rotaria sordida TaxID=392033 RepID=A0A813XHM6_9BILA|nr:unnamed protein product [Rotaria sordida]CAF0887959.1 unnamed protein product [Rotaria sordida]